MKFSKPTIHDIARALKISPATVSRALRNTYDVSQETRNRVLEVAAKLEYEPDAMALNFRQGRTQTIAVVVPDISENFFAAAISGVEDESENAGFNLLINQTKDSVEREERIVRMLLTKNVDGLIISACKNASRHHNHIESIERKGVPFVFLDRWHDMPNVSKIFFDYEMAVYSAVEHYLKMGHSNIILVVGAEDLSTTKLAMKGFHKILHKNNITFNTQSILSVANADKDEIVLRIEKLGQTEVVIFLDEKIGMRISSSLKKFNPLLKICTFVSNDSYSSESTDVITQPVYAMGQMASHLLLHHINTNAEKIVNRTVMFNGQVTIS